jgi:L,D-transpeptidase ErfK/SrfK
LQTCIRAGVAFGALALAGCSLLSAPWSKAPPPPPPVAPATPAPEPVLPLPVATHKFELSDPKDDVYGEVQVTIAGKEDTLPDIARRFNVGYEEIVRANPGVDPWIPGAGRKIVVPTRFVLPNAPREGIVINLAAMRIYYFPRHKANEAALVYTHPIGVGKVGWQTPEGVTRIVSREENPTWRPSAGVRKEHAANDDPVPAIVPPGPDNPLGKFKFTLGWPSYLIHGTNKPYGVGLRSSHGCIRLYPEDIAKFYEAVPLGTPVRVVNQPFLFGWHDGQLYLQAYTVFEDDSRNWSKAQKALLLKSMSPRLEKLLKTAGTKIDWDAVTQVANAPRGLAVAVSGGAGSVDGVLAAAPVVQNRIPAGANWDGADEVDADKQSFQQLQSEREPSPTAGADAAAVPGAPAATQLPAPAAPAAAATDHASPASPGG